MADSVALLNAARLGDTGGGKHEDQPTDWERVPSVVDVALVAGGKLRAKLDALRLALLEGDDSTALEIARDICGLKERVPRAA
ncbi:hypothetical protein [Fundidesulfovibrio magnetotacticus]|uniref:hypothetical protein n=1 Tax=Fundidesulfovibrio magnetotacticus TaxID=2730080 RepID=UPI001563DB8D|nr:hypothetical protein [Fundidesulfovibrio magnetotacticus]